MRRRTWVLLLRKREVAVWRVTRHEARKVAAQSSDEAGRTAGTHSLRKARGQGFSPQVNLQVERFAMDSLLGGRGERR